MLLHRVVQVASEPIALSRERQVLPQRKQFPQLAYFYGEDNNITALFGKKLPDIPEGYNYDFVNADALINVLQVKNGRIITPSGMSYEVLVLDANAKKMSLPVLRKIRDLVKAGATIAGVKPEQTPSLGDDTAEFSAIVVEVWGRNNKNVYTGQPLMQVLSAINVPPDVTYSKLQKDTEVLYVHRQLLDQEIYWVNNRKNRVEEVEASFRVTGKAPEIWYPETGKTVPASYRIANGRTTVPLRLNPNEALFVVFHDAATSQSRTLRQPVESRIATLDGSWDVSFQPDRGAPARITLDRLISWSESTDPGVKYFSGTAVYSRTVNAPADWFGRGARLWLDLGDVENLAEVLVNGIQLGIIWKTPFRVDVTEALKPGTNVVEIKVTNLWVNRLIGDQQPNISKKYTWVLRKNSRRNLMPIRRLLSIVLFLAPFVAAQTAQRDVWEPFKFFVGSWEGTGKGQPGVSKTEREYKFVLNGKFLRIENRSVYEPQARNPNGEVHEDWGMLSFDKSRKQFVLRQFHVEGFVNQYVQTSAAPDGKSFVFTTEQIENIPAGWRARETYRIVGPDEFVEVFELAEPGKGFEIYTESRYRRKK